MPERETMIFDTLSALTRSIRAAFEMRVERYGLTFARARLLTAIGRDEGASQARLAATLGIETPTLSGSWTRWNSRAWPSAGCCPGTPASTPST